MEINVDRCSVRSDVQKIKHLQFYFLLICFTFYYFQITFKVIYCDQPLTQSCNSKTTSYGTVIISVTVIKNMLSLSGFHCLAVRFSLCINTTFVSQLAFLFLQFLSFYCFILSNVMFYVN